MGPWCDHAVLMLWPCCGPAEGHQLAAAGRQLASGASPQPHAAGRGSKLLAVL